MTFPRATKPRSTVGSPEIVGFIDGSDNAFAAVVYLRWTLLVQTQHHLKSGCLVTLNAPWLALRKLVVHLENISAIGLETLSTIRLGSRSTAMLVMMENALVKAEDDDERINVVQEIGSVMQVI